MNQDIRKSIDACAAHYGDDAEAMRAYLWAGLEAAQQLPNRGPIRFDDQGELAADIREAYSQYGFYVFESVLGAEELSDIHADLEQMRQRFPTAPDSKLAADGSPALGSDCEGLNLLWSKPLGDPLGGTELANGRHQIKLFEPKAADDAPTFAPFILMGSLQFSETCLRTYAHPELLRVAAAINGADFAPFHESLFIKDPGVGAAVSWHQDGDTHWDNEQFDEGIHGFNFMAQVYGSTPVNGVWVLPGTHRQGKLDITQLVKESGSERLQGAVPLVCEPGDVIICNRQLVHGSFANTGFEPRLTVNFGFHRRSSVQDVMGSGMHSAAAVYDDDFIAHRSRLLGYAIDARRQRFPDETPYEYQPFVQDNKEFHWNEAAKADIRDYNMHDLSI